MGSVSWPWLSCAAWGSAVRAGSWAACDWAKRRAPVGLDGIVRASRVARTRLLRWMA